MGERPAATQAAIQAPWAALRTRMPAGTPTPPVETHATSCYSTSGRDTGHPHSITSGLTDCISQWTRLCSAEQGKQDEDLSNSIHL